MLRWYESEAETDRGPLQFLSISRPCRIYNFTIFLPIYHFSALISLTRPTGMTWQTRLTRVIRINILARTTMLTRLTILTWLTRVGRMNIMPLRTNRKRGDGGGSHQIKTLGAQMPDPISVPILTKSADLSSPSTNSTDLVESVQIRPEVPIGESAVAPSVGLIFF